MVPLKLSLKEPVLRTRAPDGIPMSFCQLVSFMEPEVSTYGCLWWFARSIWPFLGWFAWTNRSPCLLTPDLKTGGRGPCKAHSRKQTPPKKWIVKVKVSKFEVIFMVFSRFHHFLCFFCRNVLFCICFSFMNLVSMDFGAMNLWKQTGSLLDNLQRGKRTLGLIFWGMNWLHIFQSPWYQTNRYPFFGVGPRLM